MVKENKKESVHAILAHSYYVFFLLFLIGILIDFIYPVKVFQSQFFQILGLFFIVFSSIFINWAKKFTKKFNKNDISIATFSKGPYKYTRSPVHWGLSLLMIGFALIMQALFIFIAALFFMLIGKLFFLKKEELLLSKKYGKPYLAYLKKVKF